jgi:hypothetical protein
VRSLQRRSKAGDSCRPELVSLVGALLDAAGELVQLRGLVEFA